MMNLIDVYSKGRFLGGMIATMEAVFDEVQVFSEGAPARDQPNVRNTYILVGTKRPWDPAPVIAGYDPHLGLSPLGDEERADLLRRNGGRLISDDWAPIDNFLAPVVNMASREVAAATIVDRAEDLLESGDTKAALEACEQALRLHELDPNVRRVYANALIKSGDLAGAAHQFEELLRVRPDLLGARVQLASVLARLGRIDEGIVHIEDAIARSPGEAQPHFVRGILLEQAKREEDAIEAYVQASRLDPSNLEIRNNLGIALARSGRNDEAKRTFEEILAADPNFAKARQNLQRLLASQQS
jgi:tetratricopeptide (TPR) repeat protein